MFEPVEASSEVFESKWKLTRAWIIFFERLPFAVAKALGFGPFTRTLLLKDLTVGVSIADHTTIWKDGTAKRVTATLRKALSADLKVELWKIDAKNTGAGFQKLIAMTIPQAHAINTPMDFTSFTSNSLKAMHDGDVLRWDITASDGQTDRSGVAAFSFQWQ